MVFQWGKLMNYTSKWRNGLGRGIHSTHKSRYHCIVYCKSPLKKQLQWTTDFHNNSKDLWSRQIEKFHGSGRWTAMLRGNTVSAKQKSGECQALVLTGDHRHLSLSLVMACNMTASTCQSVPSSSQKVQTEEPVWRASLLIRVCVWFGFFGEWKCAVFLIWK